VELIQQLRDGLPHGRAEVMVAPSFTALEAVRGALAGSGIALGAQNVHWEPQGRSPGRSRWGC
jgi:triosephosphate isomerase